MIVPDWFRLLLYIGVAISPIWQEFFTKSSDFSLRGLAMPTIATIGAACAIVLARTKGRAEKPPQDDTNVKP